MSIFPYLLRPIMNAVAGVLCDVLVNRGITSMAVARKLSQALSAMLPATVLVVLSFTTPSTIVASVLIVRPNLPLTLTQLEH